MTDPGADWLTLGRSPASGHGSRRSRATIATPSTRRSARPMRCSPSTSSASSSPPGGSPVELGQAVIVELVRLSGASAGAIWLGETGREELALLAATGVYDEPLPGPAGRCRGWPAHRPSEPRPAARRARRRTAGDAPRAREAGRTGGELDADGLRVAQLARHELAVAFSGARLREALERRAARAQRRRRRRDRRDPPGRREHDASFGSIRPASGRWGSRPRPRSGGPAREVLGCAAAGGHGEEQCPLAEVIAIRRADRLSRNRRSSRRSAGPIRVAGGYSRAPSEPGGAIRATAILRDITAVRALEQLREGFVATVSHELRTPLALVRGYAETVLQFDLDPAQQRDYVDRIHQVTTPPWIARRPDPRRDPPRRRSARSSSAPRSRSPLSPRGSAAISRCPATTPASSSTFRRTCRRSTSTRGGSAGCSRTSSATPSSTPRTGRRSCLRAAVDGEWLVATVDDEGVGIPEAERSLVLEPFHRAWNVRESRIPGTGLGLYICRRLVEAHGGRLWLGDRPDGLPGTRVSFSLPRRRAFSGLATAVAERILIVEDEPEFASLLELWMAKAGYRPVVAVDGQRRPSPLLRRPPRPRHPRRRAARSRRLAGHRADPRVQPGPDSHGHGSELGGGQGPRAQARRRRLHHEAARASPSSSPGSRRPSAGRRRRHPSGRAGCSTATWSSTSTIIERGCAATTSA